MKFTFLGTAAAERIPSLFCVCPTCVHAREHRGRNVRRCCSALINDDLLIDIGPDLPDVALDQQLPLERVRYALQTHPHNDHLNGLTFVSRSTGTRATVANQLDYYCGPSTPPMLEHKMQRPAGFFADPANQEAFNVTMHLVHPGDTMEFGNYSVQSIPANHDGIPDAMLYAIRDNRSGASVFYGTDTGPLDPSIWMPLATNGWRFDLFILDFTSPLGARNDRHLNREQFLETMGDARSAGLIDDGTRVMGTHFVHHSAPPHDELAAMLAADGIEPAYDGLTLSL